MNALSVKNSDLKTASAVTITTATITTATIAILKNSVYTITVITIASTGKGFSSAWKKSAATAIAAITIITNGKPHHVYSMTQI